MNEITTLLRKRAELEKVAYTEFVKSATSESIKLLVGASVPFEKAASMVAASFEDSMELKEKIDSFTLLEKIAEYIDSFDSKVIGMEAAAKEQTIRAPMTKLASYGLTEQELKSLSDLEPELLEKIAATPNPSEMGHRVGVALEKSDPFINWILDR